jgi:ParB/RepB/Spo0J family partition protein
MTAEMNPMLMTVLVSLCDHSPYNVRTTWPEEDVAKIADRIRRDGYTPTRALHAIQVDDRYEVFAGGKRLEAARMAGRDEVPISLYEGLSDMELVSRSLQDNAEDESHEEVCPVDRWAAYYRLRHEKDWSQKQIAEVFDVGENRVSERIKWHRELHDDIKDKVRAGELDEGHIAAIMQNRLLPTSEVAPWQTADDVRRKVVRRITGENGPKSVRATEAIVKGAGEVVQTVNEIYEELPDEIVPLTGTSDQTAGATYHARQEFVELLAEAGARTLRQVKRVEHPVRKRIAELGGDSDLTQVEREEATLNRFQHGDARKLLPQWIERKIQLVLMDGPYGVNQQNRQRAVPWPRIDGDRPEEAIPLHVAVLEQLLPHLDEHAHVLMFCDRRREGEFRQAIEGIAGSPLAYEDSLVWDRMHQGAGNLSRFGPQYEHILHYIKGSPPKVDPRLSNVRRHAKPLGSKHPTEKPIALLEELIRCTTEPGDLVVDPFAGLASTLVAAHRSGRDYWGCEIDEEYHDEGSARLLRALEGTGESEAEEEEHRAVDAHQSSDFFYRPTREQSRVLRVLLEMQGTPAETSDVV